MILPKGLGVTIGGKTYKNNIPDRMLTDNLKASVLKAIDTAKAKEKKNVKPDIGSEDVK